MNFISDAGLSGLPVKVQGSMAYLYGLSDFWSTLFQDQKLVDSLLEVSTHQLGEAYSGFLQRAGNISVSSIQEEYNSELKLLLLSQKDSISPLSGTTFKLPERMKAKYVMNRPILPSKVMTEGVHFEISEDGLEITFFRPLDQLGFPRRVTEDGTGQVALWLSDVNINEEVIWKQYGWTVGMTEERSIGNYKDFVKGLYYLYSQGPVIDYVVAGVNLALGIPTVRENEEVLSVLQDPRSGHWQVLTPKHYYEIPYGFFPNISAGEKLYEGQQLTSWVEIKDYVKDGKWWNNTYIPKELTGGELLDPITPNSDGDYLMQNYLRFNTFMVLFKQAGITLDGYYTVSDVIFRARPSHTYPVFVWSAPMGDELVDIRDDELWWDYIVTVQDNIYETAIIDLVRDDENQYINRGMGAYLRNQLPLYHARMAGKNQERGNFRGVNQDGRHYSGPGGWRDELGDFDLRDANRMDPAMKTRGITGPRNRSVGLNSYRGHDLGTTEEMVITRGGVTFDNRQVVPLYMAHIEEMSEKIKAAGLSTKLVPGSPPLLERAKLRDIFDKILVKTPGDRGEDYDKRLDPKFTFKYSEDIPVNLGRQCGMMWIPRPEDLPEEGTLFFSEGIHDYWSIGILIEGATILPTFFPVDDGRPIDMALNFTKVTRQTARAGVMLTDSRGNQSGLYRNGVDDTEIVFDRSNPQGLRGFIRKD